MTSVCLDGISEAQQCAPSPGTKTLAFTTAHICASDVKPVGRTPRGRFASDVTRWLRGILCLRDYGTERIGRAYIMPVMGGRSTCSPRTESDVWCRFGHDRSNEWLFDAKESLCVVRY